MWGSCASQTDSSPTRFPVTAKVAMNHFTLLQRLITHCLSNSLKANFGALLPHILFLFWFFWVNKLEIPEIVLSLQKTANPDVNIYMGHELKWYRDGQRITTSAAIYNCYSACFSSKFARNLTSSNNILYAVFGPCCTHTFPKNNNNRQ